MKVQNLAYTLLSIALIVLFLSYSKTILIPIILSVVLWYVINAVNQLFERIPVIGAVIPHQIWLTLASLIVISILFVIGTLIGQTINGLAVTAPSYEVNLEHQLEGLLALVGYEKSVDLATLSTKLDLGNIIGSLLTSFRLLAKNFFLVLLYTLFLLIEQHTFPRKMAALRIDKDKKERINGILDNVNTAVKKYIIVKFTASVATGLLSYVVMRFAGLEFATFWAFLIFVFNFIPTIGSIAATIFPSLIALIQYETLGPFFIVLIGVGVIQLIIGGILEPKFYGDTLNISPFAIIMSLVIWGVLWGIVGMLLCVPITVILINIFKQFPKTRPVAVLLSQSGKL